MLFFCIFAALREIISNLKMKNKLFYGDNLEVLRKYVKDESVDLCYIDPPFNSKRNYNQIYNNVGKEDIAQAQAFIDTWTWDKMANEGFEDIVNNKTGIQTKQSINLILGMEKILGKGSLLAYLVSMTQRIAEIHRILKKTGSFYLHCDPTASHYLKLVCDAIFCTCGGDFKNEIIWKRTFNSGSSKARANKYPVSTDYILFYTKSDNYTFNRAFRPYSEGAIKRYDKLDEEGKRFKWNPMKTYSQKKLDELIAKGKAKIIPTSKYPVYKHYFDDTKGAPVDNIWIDIEQLGTKAAERLGYPTQKPEALLERIINTSSNERDTILDAYCGCGTTIAVAERLKRNWIGIDITYQSISLILKRLEDTFGGDFTKDVVDKESKQIIRPATVELNGVPQDFASAVALANKKDDRLRKEFEKWFVLAYSNNRAVINDKKGGDGGIDGTAYMVDIDEKGAQEYKQVIFSVKSSEKLSPSVIRDLFGTLERENAAMGYLLTLYPMPNLVKEAAKYGNYQNKMFGHSYPKITVVNVQELIDGAVMAIPTVVSVLKSAERKSKKEKTKDIFEEAQAEYLL